MRRLLLLGLLASCGTARTSSEGTAGAVFPHPEGYSLPAGHGADFAADPASCTVCHALDASEGIACHDCHPTYPHGAGFHFGAEHGPTWGESCHGCHGEAGDHAPAGWVESRCVSCHSTFPHPPGWMRAELHGQAVVDRGGLGACTTCHTDTASCTACHPDYPHPPSYADSHGETYPGGRCGDSCHDSATDLPADIRCATCHDGFPHPRGWASPSSHGHVVQSRGTSSCEGCHASRAPGPPLPVSCAPACHGGGGH